MVSPQNIDDDVLTLLADSKVRHLYLLQNRYTPAAIAITPGTVKGWRMVRRDNPNLRVHLRVESTSSAEILLQPEAPVHSMIYQSPKTMVSSCASVTVISKPLNKVVHFPWWFLECYYRVQVCINTSNSKTESFEWVATVWLTSRVSNFVD